MTAALSIAARMAVWVVLASWQRESIGGADVHKYADNQTSARSGAEIERASGRCGSAMRRATRLEVD